MAEGIGGIDASIPLQAGRGIEAPNPLKQIGEFAGIQNALNAAKLNPGALELQSQAVLRNKMTLNQATYQQLLPAAGDKDLTLGKLTTMLGSIEHNLGYPTGGILPDIIAATTNGDPATAMDRVRTLISSRAMSSPESSYAQSVGQPVDQNTGLSINSGVRAPLHAGGGVSVGSTTNVFPSRGEQMQRIPGPPGPGGAPTSIPQGPVTPSYLTGLPSMGTGRITPPPGLANPNALAPVTSPGATIPGQITTGPGPGETQRLATIGGDAAKGFDAISQEGVKARAQDALLGNMMTDLTMFTSGSQAEKTLGFKRFLQSWGAPIGATFGIDPKSVAAQESYKKLVNQISDAQGAGSDARLHVNQGANPNEELSPQGADFILRQLRGNADYLRARQQYADKWADKGDLQGFNANVTKNLDPRVFQYERLTPEQRADYFKGIKDKAERDAFKRSHGWAMTNGLIGSVNAGQ